MRFKCSNLRVSYRSQESGFPSALYEDLADAAATSAVTVLLAVEQADTAVSLHDTTPAAIYIRDAYDTATDDDADDGPLTIGSAGDDRDGGPAGRDDAPNDEDEDDGPTYDRTIINLAPDDDGTMTAVDRGVVRSALLVGAERVWAFQPVTRRDDGLHGEYELTLHTHYDLASIAGSPDDFDRESYLDRTFSRDRP